MSPVSHDTEALDTEALDDAQHQSWQRWEWIAERVGTTFIALVLLAAAVGLLGPGPLSHRTVVSDQGTLSIEHHFIQRSEAPSSLTIRTKAVPGENRSLRVGISRSLIDRIKIEGMTPSPRMSELEDERVIYSFTSADLKKEGRILIRYQHERCGPLSYTVTAGNNAHVEVHELILP